MRVAARIHVTLKIYEGANKRPSVRPSACVVRFSVERAYSGLLVDIYLSLSFWESLSVMKYPFSLTFSAKPHAYKSGLL